MKSGIVSAHIWGRSDGRGTIPIYNYLGQEELSNILAEFYEHLKHHLVCFQYYA